MIDFILRPIRRNFGKDKRFYAAVDDMFGFIPNNIELYKLALIHKSASIVLDDGQHINNERLEFLGDAVLECVSSDYLFIEYPDKNEGFLTKLRSKMVSRQMLNEVAKRIGLDQYVITHSSNNISQKHIYGDAFEAMMGAIYLDQGYDFVNRLLINKLFVDYIKVDQLTQAETDFKSRLIEWCQKNHHSIHFDTENDKTYSSTHPFFYSKVLIDNIEMGYGAGESKKEAEQRAAYSVSQGFSDEDCTKLLDKLDLLDAKSKAYSMRQPKSAVSSNVASEKSERAERTEKVEKVEKVEKAEKAERTEKVEKAESQSAKEEKPIKEEKLVRVEKPVKEEKPAKVEKPAPEQKPAKQEVESEAVESEPIMVADESKPVAAKPRRTRKPAPKKSKAEPAVESVAVESESVDDSAEKLAENSSENITIEKADTTTESVNKKPRRRTSSRTKSAKTKDAVENKTAESNENKADPKADPKAEVIPEAMPEAKADADDTKAKKVAKKAPRRRAKKSSQPAQTASSEQSVAESQSSDNQSVSQK